MSQALEKKFRLLVAAAHVVLGSYAFLLLFNPLGLAGSPKFWDTWVNAHAEIALGLVLFFAFLPLVLLFVKADAVIWIVFLIDAIASIFAVALHDFALLPFLLAPGFAAGIFRFVPYVFALAGVSTIQLMVFLSQLLPRFFQNKPIAEDGSLFAFGFAFLFMDAVAIALAFGIHRTVGETRQGEGLLDLIRVSHEMGAIHNYDKISGLLTKVIKTMFDVHSFGLYVLEEKDGKQLVVPRWIESSHPQIFLPFDPDLEGTVLGDAIRSHKPQAVHDLRQRNDRVLQHLPTFRAGLFHPILFEKEVIGLIFLISGTPGAYGTEQVSVLELLSSQVAVTLKNINLYQKTATMAITDSLTNLYTHGYFQDQLMKLVVECKYTEKPIGLIILDVDHFKVINDSYGHPQGDYLLRQLAGLVKSLARSEDIVSRYGGDEFVVILPGLDRVSSCAVAERIRKAVEEYSFITGSKSVNITVSAGVSCFPERVTTKDLVQAADEALYESKKRGRNQIYFI